MGLSVLTSTIPLEELVKYNLLSSTNVSPADEVMERYSSLSATSLCSGSCIVGKYNNVSVMSHLISDG